MIVMTVPEQEAGQLLAGVTKAAHGSQTSPDQIPHRLMRAVRNPHWREFACAMEPGQLYRVPAIRLDPIARATGRLGINDGATTTQLCPAPAAWRWMPYPHGPAS